MTRFLCTLVFFVSLVSACASAPSVKAPASSGKKASVILLGEAHRAQQAEIRKRLEELKPTQVLLEIPADLFNQTGIPKEDVRPSLPPFAGWEYCVEHKIPCRGFDMQGQDKFNHATHLPARLNVFVNRYLKWVKRTHPELHERLDKSIAAYEECGKADLKRKNSAACDEAVEGERLEIGHAIRVASMQGELKRLRDHGVFALGEEDWERRNAAMALNICSFALDAGGLTVVQVGADHRYLLKRLLAECPVELREPF